MNKTNNGLVIEKSGNSWNVARVTEDGAWHVATTKTKKEAQGWVRVYESWQAAGIVK
jgi:hypothetical protein